MALSNSPKTGLLIHGALGDLHHTELMKRWRGLDILLQPVVINMTTTTPPGSPADGDIYIPATGASGAWTGHVGKFARYSSVATAWEFITPANGWVLIDNSTGHRYQHNGTNWLFVEGFGTGANRPATNIKTGANYFNTTTGIPNFWNGTGWVDATGASV